MTDPLATRVSALERQLAELTARFETAPPSAPAPTPDAAATSSSTDTFWALDGLKQRVGGASAVLYTGSVDLPGGEHYDWQFGTAVDDIFDADWADWAGTLAALGHPARLLLLRRVMGGAHTTAELATDEGLGTTGQIYHHLRQLVSAGWLHSSTRGHYSVPGRRVVPLLVILSGVRR